MTPSTENESSKRIVNELKGIAAFADLSDEDLQWFVEHSTEHQFAPGEVMVHEGQPTENMIVMLEGEFVARQEASGPDSPVFNLKAGAITGRLPYSRMRQATVTSRAVTTVRVLLVSSKYFPAILHRMPLLGERLGDRLGR